MRLFTIPFILLSFAQGCDSAGDEDSGVLPGFAEPFGSCDMLRCSGVCWSGTAGGPTCAPYCDQNSDCGYHGYPEGEWYPASCEIGVDPEQTNSAVCVMPCDENGECPTGYVCAVTPGESNQACAVINPNSPGTTTEVQPTSTPTESSSSDGTLGDTMQSTGSTSNATEPGATTGSSGSSSTSSETDASSSTGSGSTETSTG
jgi:hypothetical protein